ncbi:TIGR02677 family protein [Tepidibacillus infernus]|uniref:TIGR02677 family protein n=1 Tax=Tepidibacillus infernus TaxID=1806172 RepID=UPI003B6D6149
MNDQMLRAISEVTYLTTDNAWRYRSILRYFYQQHERLRHYLFPEEIYEYLKQNFHFQEYTEEQLQNDLNQLVQWKNIIPRQETGRVNSIEDFKKKKFRYQATPYTIEIERMVQGLEKLGDSFGGSLEKTLFDRLLESLYQLTAYHENPFHKGKREYDVDKLDNEALYRLWEDMFDQFRKMAENATDYIAYLKSEKVEEVMMTETFLAFKDALTEYLRNFMSALQRSSFKIESVLHDTKTDFIEHVANRIATYQLSIPRLINLPNEQDLIQQSIDQWQSLQKWFLGENGRESELSFLQNETNETIRRMTRFAQRIGERSQNFRSRRKDYLHLAKWFAEMQDIQEAHKLSSVVFGAFHTRHFQTDGIETEDIYSEVWDQPPTIFTLKPRIKQYKEKTRPGIIVNKEREKKETLQQYLLEKEAEQKMMEQIMNQDRIVLSQLTIVDPYVRKTLLNWIAKAMGNKEQIGKTETGRRFKLLQLNDSMIQLESEDGWLRMPNYVFYFID